MPMYEFVCRECNIRFEELVFSASSPLDDIVCPECGSGKVEKLISAASFSGVSDTAGGSCGPLPSGGYG